MNLRSLLLLIAFGVLLTLGSTLYLARAYLLQTVVSSLINRQVQIGEVVNIDLGKQVSTSVKRLSVQAPDLDLQAEDFLIEIDLRDWWDHGGLNITRLAVSDARVSLTPLPARGESGPLLLPTEFQLTRIKIEYRDAVRSWNARAERCNGLNNPVTNIIEVDCRGTLNEAPVTIAGRYGLPGYSGTDEPLDIKASWGDFNITAMGRLDSLTDLIDAHVNVSIVSPDVRPLLSILGFNKIRDGDINVKGSIIHQDDDFAFDLNGSIAGFRVVTTGHTDNFARLSRLKLDFLVSGPSLYEAGSLFNELRLAEKPFQLSGELSFANATLLVPQVSLQIDEGTLHGSMNMPHFPDTVGMHLNLSGKSFRPDFLNPVAEACGLPHEPVDMTAEITLLDGEGQLIMASLKSPTYDLMLNGSLNNPVGDFDLGMTLTGTTFETLGQCFAVKLPDTPARVVATVAKRENYLFLEDIDLRSDLVDITGQFSLELEAERVFETRLKLRAPNARQLLAGFVDRPGPLGEFPLTAAISLHGSAAFIVLDDLAILSGEQTGYAKGNLGEPGSFRGFDLHLELKGDNMRHLLVDEESSTSQPQPYNITLDLLKEDDTWVIQSLDGTLARSTVQLTARFPKQPDYVGTSLQISAKGENIENLLGPWVSYPIPSLPFSLATGIDITENEFRFTDLNGFVGGHVLVADILADRPPNLARSKGYVSLQGPDINELTHLFGMKYQLLSRPYNTSFNVKGSSGAWILDNFSATLGETDFAGNASFEYATPVRFDIDFSSRSLYVPLINPKLLDEEEAEDITRKKKVSVFPDIELPVHWLDIAEGQMKVDLNKVWITPEEGSHIKTDLQIQQGKLTTRKFTWDSKESEGQMNIEAHQTDGVLSVSVDADSSRLPLLWLLAGEALPSEGTSFKAVVNSHGNNVKTLIGNLNGEVLFKGGAGRMQTGRLEAVFGDFLQTISRSIIDREKGKLTNVACTAAGIRINDGLMKFQPGLVAQTDQVNLYANGSINLKTEQPDMVIATKPRTGLGISAKVLAPRIKVTGTLADPGLSVDTKTTALSAYAAFMTGGVSMLATGVWDRVTRSADPCGDLYEQARQEIKFR